MAAAVTRTNESVGANGPAPGYWTHCTPSTRYSHGQMPGYNWWCSMSQGSPDRISVRILSTIYPIYYLHLTRNQKINSDCKPLFFPPCIRNESIYRRLSRIIFTRTRTFLKITLNIYSFTKWIKLIKVSPSVAPMYPQCGKRGGECRGWFRVQSAETGSGPEVASSSH